MSGNAAFVCGDGSWPRSPAHYARDVAIDRERYPLAGAMAANIWPCAFWQVQHVDRTVALGGPGPRNILMLQNARDSATPVEGAQSMRARFGARAQLVIADAGGHGVYYRTRNPCAVAAADDFLRTGRLVADLSCPSAP